MLVWFHVLENMWMRRVVHFIAGPKVEKVGCWPSLVSFFFPFIPSKPHPLAHEKVPSTLRGILSPVLILWRHTHRHKGEPRSPRWVYSSQVGSEDKLPYHSYIEEAWMNSLKLVCAYCVDNEKKRKFTPFHFQIGALFTGNPIKAVCFFWNSSKYLIKFSRASMLNTRW